jgi:hypothetical protein
MMNLFLTRQLLFDDVDSASDIPTKSSQEVQDDEAAVPPQSEQEDKASVEEAVVSDDSAVIDDGASDNLTGSTEGQEAPPPQS